MGTGAVLRKVNASKKAVHAGLHINMPQAMQYSDYMLVLFNYLPPQESLWGQIHIFQFYDLTGSTMAGTTKCHFRDLPWQHNFI